MVDLSCLPQSKHLLEPYKDAGDVKSFSRVVRPKASIGSTKLPEWLDADNKQLLGDIDITLATACDKDWIYHANGEIWGRCVLKPLIESSNSI